MIETPVAIKSNPAGLRTLDGTATRLPELDALRGIAALFVVLYHYTDRFPELYSQPPGLAASLPIGHYGVQLFFVVSGFVILMTLQRTERPRDFVILRFGRLYPCYWAAVFLTFLIVRLMGLPGREVSGAAAIVNLSMLQGFLRIPSVDGVYWTLTVELVFYFWMFVVFATGAIARIERVAAAALVAMLTSGLWEHFSGTQLREGISLILLLDWGHLFIAGIVFHSVRTHGRSLLRLSILLSVVGVDFVRNGIESSAVVAIILIVFALVISGRGGLLRAPALVWLGFLTYPLYLLHQNIGYVLLGRLYAVGVHPNAAVPITILLAVGLAWVLHRFVEDPANRVARRFVKSRVSPVEATPASSPP